jgi:hypothetical protein
MRRAVISYVFSEVCGSPPQAYWEDNNIVSGIMMRLGLPSAAEVEVEKVMIDTLACKAKGTEYDAEAAQGCAGIGQFNVAG